MRKLTVVVFCLMSILLAGCSSLFLGSAPLEPGMYTVQLRFAPDTAESEMQKVFGVDFTNSFFKAADGSPHSARVIESAARARERPASIYALFLALPIDWWADFPVRTQDGRNVMELPVRSFSTPEFDGRTFRSTVALSSKEYARLEGRAKDRNTVAGTFQVLIRGTNGISDQQTAVNGTFIIWRAGALTK